MPAEAIKKKRKALGLDSPDFLPTGAVDEAVLGPADQLKKDVKGAIEISPFINNSLKHVVDAVPTSVDDIGLEMLTSAIPGGKLIRKMNVIPGEWNFIKRLMGDKASQKMLKDAVPSLELDFDNRTIQYLEEEIPSLVDAFQGVAKTPKTLMKDSSFKTSGNIQSTRKSSGLPHAEPAPVRTQEMEESKVIRGRAAVDRGLSEVMTPARLPAFKEMHMPENSLKSVKDNKAIARQKLRNQKVQEREDSNVSAIADGKWLDWLRETHPEHYTKELTERVEKDISVNHLVYYPEITKDLSRISKQLNKKSRFHGETE